MCDTREGVGDLTQDDESNEILYKELLERATDLNVCFQVSHTAVDFYPFKTQAQTALFKAPVRTAL